MIFGTRMHILVLMHKPAWLRGFCKTFLVKDFEDPWLRAPGQDGLPAANSLS